MQTINIADLHEHKHNTYYFDDMEGQKWIEFVNSIRTSGVIEPLVVTQDKVIVSGHQRVRACRELGIETVFCDVRLYEDKDGRSKDDWITKDLIETNVRQRGIVGGSELKAMHRVDKLREIYNVKNGGDRKSENAKIRRENSTTDIEPSTIAEVTKAAGISVDVYKKMQSLRDLIPEAEELLESGRITASTAASIVGKLSPDEQLKLIESLPTSERLTARVVQEYTKKLQDKENEYTTESADLTNRLEKQVRINDVLENKIAQLKRAGDPDLIAIKDRLEADLRKEYERGQSYKAEADRARRRAETAEERAAKDRAKADEASDDMNELLDRIEELEQQIGLYTHNVTTDADPIAENQLGTYTMSTLLNLLKMCSTEIGSHTASNCVDVNAKHEDYDQIVSFIDAIMSNLLILKNQIRERKDVNNN